MQPGTIMRTDTFQSLLLGAVLLGAHALAMAGDVIVIANPGVNITADEVRDVFTGEKQLAGGVKLVPMDNSAAQADFLAKVIKVDANKYASIWTKKGFRDGMTAPGVRSGDAEVISAVKSTPGAIGYVSKAPADVKVIQKY
jgi:ABC-type phosphate transport system substrate-binding protein